MIVLLVNLHKPINLSVVCLAVVVNISHFRHLLKLLGQYWQNLVCLALSARGFIVVQMEVVAPREQRQVKQEHRQRMQYTPFKCLWIMILTIIYLALELLLIKIIDWPKLNAKLLSPENSKFCEKYKWYPASEAQISMQYTRCT